MMQPPPYYIKFENLIREYFSLRGFNIETKKTGSKDLVSSYDLNVIKRNEKYLIDIKFYRSKLIPINIINHSIKNLNQLLNFDEFVNHRGILIVNSVLSHKLVVEYYDKFGIEIWDRNNLANRLSEISIELNEKFEKLLIDTQQGIDISPVLHEENISPSYIDTINPNINIKNIDSISDNSIGEKLCKELRDIKCGKTGWSNYEKKVLEILKNLFANDLSLWNKQSITDDKILRFDLICRISSKDDFWKSLISSFNTRYILFEFKNYCNKINQNEIYTTERYLFTKALRSVAFVIARDGGNENAIIAAKGSLREYGKLIIILTNEDLCNMLKLKDQGDSPNDYLANKLDTWLCSLSR